MSSELPSFGHLTLSHRASGENVKLVRSPDEVVLLAFDTQTKRLVELHMLRGGQPMEGALKKSAMERAQQASEIRGPTFMRILEVGEDQGVVYYTSNLNEGEFVSDYVTRRGALPPATVFSLLLQLLDDVMLLADRHRLVPQLRLDRVMITTVEDTFLQLRLYDFGLGVAERTASDNSRQVLQVCELIFLMLTGRSFAGDNPDRYPALTALPMSLRTTVRAALVDPNNTPVSLEKLRDDLREAYSSQVSSIQARNTRKQLVVTSALQPRSQLQDLLLEGVPVERVLGSRFRVEDGENARRYPFSIPCINTKTEQPITVHLLPPSRVVDKSQYDAVPLQSWRFTPDKHPNILRSLSLWESPEWSFLTEERDPGFSLSRLLTERMTLNPAEVAVVLRQVNAGIEQALDCGVSQLELHPSNLFLRVGKAGPMLAREHERLMQKRLDAWPPFHVKVRPHVTMRNLYEPPLAEPPDPAKFESVHLADREHRSRSFVALAAFLLTGQRQIGDAPVFSESVPEALAVFVRETIEASHLRGFTPPPAEFVDRFESIMSGPAMPDLASRLRGSSMSLEEMESVGSVSDFDDDQPSNDLDDPDVSPISRRLHAHEFDQFPTSKRSSNWPVIAAAAVVILGLLAWWFMPRSEPAEEPIATTLTVEAKPTPEKKTEEPNKIEIAAVKAPEPENAPPAKAAEPEKPASTATTTPEPAKTTAAATPPAPVTPPALAPVKPPLDLSKPPPPVTVPNPVIIRKAIMPTPEELAKFKQGQAKPPQAPLPVQISPNPTAPLQPGSPQQIGNLPAMKMATPLEVETES
jgi:hypothetical protein